MSLLSEYQKSVLGLLDIPGWQLQHPDLVAVEQDIVTNVGSPEVVSPEQTLSEVPQPVKKLVSTEVESAAAKGAEDPIQALSLAKPEITRVEEVLLVNHGLSTLDDISKALSEYNIPHHIVTQWEQSGVRYKIAVVPDSVIGGAGETEVRYQTSLSAIQKKQLWTHICDWQRTR